MRPRLAALALAVALLHGQAAHALAAPPDVAVTIDNFAFSMEDLTVPAGTKVVWTNRDDIPHTVTSDADPRLFKSPALDTDDSFSYVFATPGTYVYFCSLHAHMTAKIIVR